MHKKQKYMLANGTILLISGIENVTTDFILQTSNGLNHDSQHEKMSIFGANEITGILKICYIFAENIFF